MARWSRHKPTTVGGKALHAWCGNRSTAEACAALGINESAFFAFKFGRLVPGKRRAERIEEATDGAVPVTVWKRKRAA